MSNNDVISDKGPFIRDATGFVAVFVIVYISELAVEALMCVDDISFLFVVGVFVFPDIGVVVVDVCAFCVLCIWFVVGFETSAVVICVVSVFFVCVEDLVSVVSKGTFFDGVSVCSSVFAVVFVVDASVETVVSE